MFFMRQSIALSLFYKALFKRFRAIVCDWSQDNETSLQTTQKQPLIMRKNKAAVIIQWEELRTVHVCLPPVGLDGLLSSAPLPSPEAWRQLTIRYHECGCFTGWKTPVLEVIIWDETHILKSETRHFHLAEDFFFPSNINNFWGSDDTDVWVVLRQ